LSLRYFSLGILYTPKATTLTFYFCFQPYLFHKNFCITSNSRIDNLWRFKQTFLTTDEMLDELPEREITRETNWADSGLDVFFNK